MADAEQRTKTTAACKRGSRSTTASARRAVGTAVVIAVLAAIGAVVACLPNLAGIDVGDAASEASPVSREGCGDGIIATLDDGGDAGESCDPGAADAGAPGCTADCQIECDGGVVDPKSNHCYFAAGIDTTFVGATARCAVARAHVVTLATQAEANRVAPLTLPFAPTYWVGLARLPSLGAYAASSLIVGTVEEPGFPIPSDAGVGTGPCLGCFGIGDDAGTFPPEVASATAGTDCIASSDGGWVQVPCTAGGGGDAAKRTTICEREPIGARAQDCIGGFCFTLGSTAGVKRYLVAVSATDPDTAAQSCAGLNGGSLVVFETPEEREQLAHEIRLRYPTEVDQQLWIGLVEDGGAWKWEDGLIAADAAARPLPWGNAQPPGDAAAGARAYMHLAPVAYDTQLAYADDGGKTPRLYICQRKPE